MVEITGDLSQLNSIELIQGDGSPSRSASGRFAARQGHSRLRDGLRDMEVAMRRVNFMVKPNGRLVLVSFMHYCTFTSSLSNT